MISEIQIRNFKSIQDLTLRPGRVTVLIGENGSGKSNVLEAIAFAACAASDKMDNEVLFPRGIRVTEDTWMLSAFPDSEIEGNTKKRIEFKIKGNDDDQMFRCSVVPTRRKEDNSFLKWRVSSPVEKKEIDTALTEGTFIKEILPRLEELKKQFQLQLDSQNQSTEKLRSEFLDFENKLKPILARVRLQAHKLKSLQGLANKLSLADFVIYAPENTVLRSPPIEGALQPLGTKGEGLFRLLQSFTDEKFIDRLTDLQARLHLFGWFDRFLPPDDSATTQARLRIHDRWLAPDKAVFDQRSANEGFLFVLFYFTLLMSWRTPKFFAIDNIDTALNPRLCSTLMGQVVELATRYDKQVICTTHNPAVLDGLDLTDDQQRLFTVRRNSFGHTIIRRVTAPEPQRPGELPVRLSEAFSRGIIGGLPEHF